MLGTWRFLLAAAVALSHVGVKPFGFHIGIAAVVAFYLISGYVVARLWLRLQGEPRPLFAFYRDRFLRIYPTYFSFLLTGVALWWALEPDSYYLSAEPGLGDWLANLFVVPLNFFMWNGTDRFVFMPPAWSLAAELQFYLCLPFLLRAPRAVFAASLAVAAAAQLGLLPREWFTYRLLPGVLHIFCAGALLGIAPDAVSRRRRATVLWCLYLGLGLVLWAAGGLFAHREPALYVEGMLNVAPELLGGLLVGLPLLTWLAPLRGTPLDRRLGDLSYGVFLCHFQIYWLLAAAGLETSRALFLGGSVLFAAAAWWLVERPAQAYRYRLRRAAPRGQGGDSG
ncbi:MAG: hypothetical protein KatS3mg124_0483 [Porticoccaceae bacterium]|nr:MAG: hypothetical protein KatS3mg124_0483 [Porticoccaceae bacterium]